MLYIVHVTAFCLGGPFFSGHGVICSVLMMQCTLTWLIPFADFTHVCYRWRQVGHPTSSFFGAPEKVTLYSNTVNCCDLMGQEFFYRRYAFSVSQPTAVKGC